jgi:LmbE family N-acetylglucosaminyl deacetylase
MQRSLQLKFLFATVTAALAASSALAPRASAQAIPETVESINKARVTTRILFITAHPDDEWSSLLSYLSRGLNADVGLLTITRGQGGQNAVGPEQGDELGIVRTEELLAAGQHYGVRQFFTRAEDTGYVRTPEQAQKIWGNVALEDMVRVIRTFRPEVVINGWGGVHGGHGHHQESGILTPQAVAAAADSKMFPDQIAEGLQPWKVGLEVRLARDSASGAVQLPVNNVSPVWGKSYVEMGMEGHALHRSQGTPAFFGNPFFRRPVYLMAENEKGEPTGGFDSKALAEPLVSLGARFPSLASQLAPALSAADDHLAAAARSALALDRPAAARSLAEAGKRISALRNEIAEQKGPDATAALWQLDRIHERIDRALAEVIALPIDTQASRHELVANESFSVDVNFLDKPAAPVQWSIDISSFEVPPGWSVSLDKKSDTSYRFNVQIPAGAKPPFSPGDVILPYPPPLVTVALHAEIEGYKFTISHPVESVEAASTGIVTYPLELVPAVTLTVEPQQVMVPASRANQPLKLVARVRYHGTQPAKVSVGIDAPSGWSVAQSESSGPLDFSAAGDQLMRFVVTPPANPTPAPGAYPLHPYARLEGDAETFRTSLDPIPTVPSRQWSEPSDTFVHVLDLTVPAGLHIGYIAAENDPLPEILRQLGIRVDLLDDVALAFGDLNRYDAIAVGIRAYELRTDLPRSNQRLLDYVKNGGTLVVQYQRDYAWNKWLPSPYPAKMPDATSRVTDQNSPVRFLAPENPLLNSPNKITQSDFEGWTQERGLYFWGTFDAKYQPVLGFTDPGQAEANGGLVYTRFGKGVYIYTGLSFFRQLPAGVPGAYRLFVNLLSQTPRQSTSD